jgi:hypothetical protein
MQLITGKTSDFIRLILGLGHRPVFPAVFIEISKAVDPWKLTIFDFNLTALNQSTYLPGEWTKRG